MSNALPNHFPGVRSAGAPVCRLVMIDNYDSFTFNLVQYFGSLGADVWVFRNDDIDLPGIAALQPDCLVISPGPCSPKEAGISVAAIQHFAGKLPILGVCLGHQAIGAAFGGTVGRSQQLMHGKTSVLTSTLPGRVCQFAQTICREPIPLPCRARSRFACRIRGDRLDRRW